MEPPFFRIVCDRSLQHWFLHCVQENTTLFGRTCEANGEPFHRPFYFHSLFVQGVVKLSFSNKFFSNWWHKYVLINMISTNSWYESERFHVLASTLPSLNDCVVTKQAFCIVLLHLFSIKFRCFISTVGFSNEVNCCQLQLQGIGKLIKEKLLKGIFKVV